MAQKRHYVTIKGTKDGFTLLLDDQCSYQELLEEIEEKLSVTTRDTDDNRLIPVRLEVGNRYLNKEQIAAISELIRTKKKLYVSQVNSNVVTKAEAERMHQEHRIVKVVKMIRSGQVLEITGDLLLIGDVNPGAKVIATGNIYVMGVLRGVAHAGAKGNINAFIAASKMEPAQLMIADIVSRSPDENQDLNHEMEYAYVDKERNQIRIDKIQTMPLLQRFLA